MLELWHLKSKWGGPQVNGNRELNGRDATWNRGMVWCFGSASIRTAYFRWRCSFPLWSKWHWPSLLSRMTNKQSDHWWINNIFDLFLYVEVALHILRLFEMLGNMNTELSELVIFWMWRQHGVALSRHGTVVVDKMLCSQRQLATSTAEPTLLTIKFRTPGHAIVMGRIMV